MVNKVHIKMLMHLLLLLSARDKDGGRAGPYSSSEISCGESLCSRDGICSPLPGNKLVGDKGWCAMLGSEKHVKHLNTF